MRHTLKIALTFRLLAGLLVPTAGLADDDGRYSAPMLGDHDRRALYSGAAAAVTGGGAYLAAIRATTTRVKFERVVMDHTGMPRKLSESEFKVLASMVMRGYEVEVTVLLEGELARAAWTKEYQTKLSEFNLIQASNLSRAERAKDPSIQSSYQLAAQRAQDAGDLTAAHLDGVIEANTDDVKPYAYKEFVPAEEFAAKAAAFETAESKIMKVTFPVEGGIRKADRLVGWTLALGVASVASSGYAIYEFLFSDEYEGASSR